MADFWWRVEFQRRGSLHIHGFFWCAAAPNPNTVAGRAAVPAYIDTFISATIPDREEDPELHRLVASVQQHRHTHTCRVPSMPADFCRFHVPFQQSPVTRYRLTSDEGLRRADTYILRRGPQDLTTNPYNPAMLRAWGANMDLQMIATGPSGGAGGGEGYAAAQYAFAYVSKAETEGMRSCVQQALETMPVRASLDHQFLRVGTACLAMQEISGQEQAFLLVGLPLKGSSRESVSVAVGFPEHRARIVRTAAMRRARRPEGAGEEDDEDDAEDAVAAGLYEKYAARPLALEEVSLYEFACGYKVVRCGRNDGPETALVVPDRSSLSGRCAKRRAHDAVARVHPRTSPESHGAEHYYSVLVLHTPWRVEEQQLPREEGALIRMLQENEPSIRERLGNNAFADELEAGVARLHALEEDGVDVHAGGHVRRCGLGWKAMWEGRGG